MTFVGIPFLWHIRDVPAWIFLGIWFLGQFLHPGDSGVAWMAHVGGFLAGLGAVRLLARTRPRRARAREVEYLPPAASRLPLVWLLTAAGRRARSRAVSGGLAQLVRAGVSYAPGPGFESLSRHT